MALTDGGEMLLTPTYHVFEMYVPFQDATVVPLEFEAMPELESGDLSVPLFAERQFQFHQRTSGVRSIR